MGWLLVFFSSCFLHGSPVELFFLFHRYVHVAFNDLEERLTIKPCSLIICGPGEGQTDQCASAFQDAIRMLLSTWEPMGRTASTASKRTLQSNKRTSFHKDDQIRNATVFKPGCVIPAGGTFEFLLNHALLQQARSCLVSDDANMGFPAVSQLLANALLCVPRQIYSHSPRCFLQTQTALLSFIQNHSPPFSLVYNQEHNTVLTQGQDKSECPLVEGKQCMHCCREADKSSKGFMLDLGLESVSCKCQLLLAVLQCVSSLLHVDTVLHIHTQSRRLANISSEGTEDEAEDWEFTLSQDESHKHFFSQVLLRYHSKVGGNNLHFIADCYKNLLLFLLLVFYLSTIYLSCKFVLPLR